MKAVRIIAPEVHDGLGGVHKAGDIAVLPAEVAQIFIEKNCGVEASDVEYAEAIAKAEAVLDDKRMAENKAAAVQRMRVHDAMPPDVREAAGKPRVGKLLLSAARERSAVLVRVKDDGRGIDRPRVLARAQELGLVGPEVTKLDAEQLFKVIASPGFSTATAVSTISGRGVGIDAVQAKVRQLGGFVELETAPGEGTTITLRLPQTLAIVRAVLARVGTERYALPLQHVRETLEWSTDAVQHVQGREVLVVRDEVLPLVRLRDVVRASGAARDEMADIIVLERGDRRAGLLVDELTDQQDIVVKQFDAARDGLALFSGATILADGRPALIMDVASLL